MQEFFLFQKQATRMTFINIWDFRRWALNYDLTILGTRNNTIEYHRLVEAKFMIISMSEE